MKLNKAQQNALVRVFERHNPYTAGSPQETVINKGWRFEHLTDPNGNTVATYWHHHSIEGVFKEARDIVDHMGYDTPMTYLQFRRSVKKGYDCVMVAVAGMWVGIESDGYTHT